MGLTLLTGNNFSGRSQKLRDFAWAREGQYLHPDLEVNLSGLAQLVSGECALHGASPPNWSSRHLSMLSGGEKAGLLLDCALALRPNRLAIDGALEQLDMVRRGDALSRLRIVAAEADILVTDDYATEMQVDAVETTCAGTAHEFKVFNSSLRNVSTKFSTGVGETAEIVARNMTFRYSRRSDLVFQKTSFSLKPGTINLLQAPNGAGKSTLARLLVGVLNPTSGSLVAADGGSLEGQVFYAFQNAREQLFGRRCDDYLATVMRLGNTRPVAWPKEWESSTELAAAFGLAPFAGIEIADMPLIARKRLSLAGAFASRAPWLFLDEPALGLDRVGRSALAHLVERAVQAGRGLIVVSHGEEFRHLSPLKQITITNGMLDTGGTDD